MPGFGSVRRLVDRIDVEGALQYVTWRKTPALVTGQGFWFDLSLSPGNPKPQYYASAPLVAATLARSTDGGINHGGNVSPSSKYLRKLMALTVTAAAAPLPLMLCDYLLYYPFIDEGEPAPQLMDNSVAIPRYPTGNGVQMAAVVVAPHATGGQSFSVTYTNSDGVGSRVTPAVVMNTQFVNGTILTSAPATASCFGPFIPLQGGDKGVRSIESVQVNGIGDVGLFTLVLVKPLADISLRGIDAPVEVDYLIDRPSMPMIVDDAYLNFFCLTFGSLSAAPIHGDASFTWT